MSKETGGPAFPLDASTPVNSVDEMKGMTLRDYFAAKAMQAQLMHPLVQKGEGTRLDVAVASYQVADAMLEARSKS